MNKCHVPIVIRTFGVPDGSPVGEAGVLHNVLAHPPVNVVSGGINLGAGATPQLAKRPVVAAITEAADQGRKFPGCRRRAISVGESSGARPHQVPAMPMVRRTPFRPTILSSLWSLILTR